MNHAWPAMCASWRTSLSAPCDLRNSVLTDEDFQFLARELEDKSALTHQPVLTLRELEKQAIEAALQRTLGNMKEAAALLGIDRSTLYEKIKKYEIARP